VFLVWNVIGTFFSILNFFNMLRYLIHLLDCLLWFNIFPLTSPAPQSDFRVESYGSLKLVGSYNLPSIVCAVTFL
jgi:hypothetical protein